MNSRYTEARIPYLVGAAAKTMANSGYQKTADPDPTKPYVMWPDSPYGHLMIPVK